MANSAHAKVTGIAPGRKRSVATTPPDQPTYLVTSSKEIKELAKAGVEYLTLKIHRGREWKRSGSSEEFAKVSS